MRLSAISTVFVVLVITSCLVRAQQTPASSGIRQSLDDAWWTGPMLAPSAATLPQGHFLIEPYLYDVITEGEYDSTGTRRSTPHANGFGSLTYMNYGLFNKLTVGMIPVFGYNEVSNGPSSAGPQVGDLTVQAEYRLKQFHEGSWIPTVSVALQETLPTGQYDRLERLSDGLGAGAFTTTVALYSQTYFWLPNGRILRMRLNLVPAFSNTVNVQDASVYGTTAGFRGHASPGSSQFVDLAWEYSLTQRWVLALDATYRHQGSTSVSGYNAGISGSGMSLIQMNSGSSQAFGVAPAIEYNWKRNLGVLLGTRLIPAGKNTGMTISPAIAINFWH